MTFLKEYKENELAVGNYFRRRENNRIEIGHRDNTKTIKPDTRLLINKTALNVNGEELYRCIISWYSADSDLCYFNNKGGNYDYKTRKYDILVQMDVFELFNNKEYFKSFMESLLKEERVMDILYEDEKENPERKSGSYIGKILKVEGKYENIFNKEIGEACYNLEENVQRRERFFKIEKLRRTRNKIIAEQNEKTLELNMKNAH